ncbi:hypothetical protein L1987_33434 [Smallanthus sonchifolius]|uniref:Uncharacterized protein n=1 Tax=Smallanthus sonchifolius TaxID=185202 RepID=A0ACB9HR24_9ASTR|nr:hypothetical protein L1987_33434 [Smallanthus sonchifolius]
MMGSQNICPREALLTLPTFIDIPMINGSSHVNGEELELLVKTKVASWLETPQSEEESTEDEDIDDGSDGCMQSQWYVGPFNVSKGCRLKREKLATANESVERSLQYAHASAR